MELFVRPKTISRLRRNRQVEVRGIVVGKCLCFFGPKYLLGLGRHSVSNLLWWRYDGKIRRFVMPVSIGVLQKLLHGLCQRGRPNDCRSFFKKL